MNRAAALTRALLVAALLLTTMAAGYLHSGIPQLPASPAVTAAGPVRHGTHKPAVFVLGAVTTNLSAFDRAVRHKAVLRMMFYRMGTPIFPGGTIALTSRRGAETVIELQPAHLTMRQISGGLGDGWLRRVFAPGIRAFGKAVTVSFAPEMNGQWYSYGFGRTKPADYIRAWRHVHNLLAGTRAGRLITWLWQPSAIHFSTASPKPWWPGSKYVDEVGLDGYYVFPADTFKIIFAQTIKLVRSLTTKPILVGETAVGATTGRMAIDIRDLFAGIRRYRLRGFVWFNISQHAGKYHQDWRLQDHPFALRAFIAQLARA